MSRRAPRTALAAPPGVTPLSELPASMQEEIEAAVALPHPPERWITFGEFRPLAQIGRRAWYEWYWRRGIDPDKLRQPLTAATRARIIERDGLVCGLCGGAVEPSDVHIDHIVPVALGGSDLDHNLQVAHSSCNLKKGARA